MTSGGSGWARPSSSTSGVKGRGLALWTRIVFVFFAFQFLQAYCLSSCNSSYRLIALSRSLCAYRLSALSRPPSSYRLIALSCLPSSYRLTALSYLLSYRLTAFIPPSMNLHIRLGKYAHFCIVLISIYLALSPNRCNNKN